MRNMKLSIKWPVVSEKRAVKQAVLAGQEINPSQTLHVENQPSGMKTDHPASIPCICGFIGDSQLVDVQKERFDIAISTGHQKVASSSMGVATKFHGVSLHHDHGALELRKITRLNTVVSNR